MAGSLSYAPTETKLQVVKLSLLPPNSKGIMPSGIQRFPFEFPIPSTLPTTVYIPGRVEIFYQLSATIRRSTTSDCPEQKNNLNLIDWVRRNNFKKDYVTCSPIRIVRSMESVVSNGLPTTNNNQTGATTFPIVTTDVSDLITNVSSLMTEDQTQSPWNRRGLNQYQGTLDELHDQLAYSLAGRMSGNLNQNVDKLDNVQGVRYKIGFDRTAIAIGTSVGIELMIEPTFANATIKSVLLRVTEDRKYAMKITSKRGQCETKRYREGVKMVLKWAYGYQLENGTIEAASDKKSHQIHGTGGKFVHQRCLSSQSSAHFEPPHLGSPNNKSFHGSDKNPKTFLVSEESIYEGSTRPAVKTCDMLNLKELNQKVDIGEYFGGRFVLPVPDCSNILHPSMEHEAITISHWINLVVTITCNGKTFDLMLESPARVLDCRVVSVDDECQTILPPPPTYKPGDGHRYQENIWAAGTFWQQREAITNVSGWGSCMPCPCQYKKLKALNNLDDGSNSNNNSKKNLVTDNETCPPNYLPEWGPPPCYSKN